MQPGRSRHGPYVTGTDLSHGQQNAARCRDGGVRGGVVVPERHCERPPDRYRRAVLPEPEVSDDEADASAPLLIAPGEPAWLTFEKDVSNFLASR